MLAATIAVLATQAAPAQEFGTVTGTVRFFDTQAPVTFAPVALVETLTPDDPPVYTTTTGADGGYLIEAEAGSYILQVQNPPENGENGEKDHLTNVLSRDFITILAGETLMFDIDDAGEDPVGQWGSIVGVVTDGRTGDRLSGVDVRLTSATGVPPANTDAFGVYAFPVVQLGVHQGRASAHGFNDATGVVNLADSFGIAQMHFALSPAPPVEADVNNDGTVDALDVQLTINIALGISAECACDVNGDGSVNALDIQLVINAVLGV